MKNQEKILAAVGVGILGIWLWAKYGKKSAPLPVIDPAKSNNTNQDTSQGTPTSSSGFSDYQKRVMVLQGKLGVAIDGIAGPQTNGALSKKLPTLYAQLGTVSSSNVEQYITALSTAQTTQAQNAYATSLVLAIMNAQGTVQMLKDYTAKQYQWDVARQRYIETGKTYAFKKGYLFSNWNKVNRNNNSIFLVAKNDPQQRYDFPPSVLTVVKTPSSWF